VKQGEDGPHQPDLSGRTSADRPTVSEARTGNSVDRAIPLTSAKQGRIRSVDDRIDFNFVISPEERLIRPRGSEHAVCQIFKECAGVAGT
jgi:hypothetical protein